MKENTPEILSHSAPNGIGAANFITAATHLLYAALVTGVLKKAFALSKNVCYNTAEWLLCHSRRRLGYNCPSPYGGA
jgi:hypothetical protein